MNEKQETVLRIIAGWADRFGCVTKAVIYGSVARGDERPTSDLDVDLEYVSDLTAPGMTKSYAEAHASFDNLRDDLFKANWSSTSPKQLRETSFGPCYEGLD
jgi:predicted nucleotidyltransferase